MKYMKLHNIVNSSAFLKKHNFTKRFICPRKVFASVNFEF